MTPKEYNSDRNIPLLLTVKTLMKEALEDLHDAKIINDAEKTMELEAILVDLRNLKKIIISNTHIYDKSDQ